MNSYLRFVGLFCFCVIGAMAAPVFYVDAQKGNDANPGTAEKPLATPTKARNLLRALPSRDGAVVELSGHFDTLGPSILMLRKEDGAASREHPVVWRAGKSGAFFSGACRIGAKDFGPVTGAALERLKPEARGKVVQCDLAKFGIGELKPLPAKFNRWTEMELISSGKAMTIARYPNQGWLEITNVVDRGVAPCDPKKDEWEFGVRGGTFEYSGTEPERWDVQTGVYLFGFWCYDWSSDTLRVAKIDKAKKTITMEGVHIYGLGKACKWQQSKVRYFAYNLLEELDAPGEWYVDRPTRTLYFYPTEAGLGEVSLSVAREPLVSIAGASNLVLQGIDFKYSTGKAVELANSVNIVLNGLSVSWLSQDAMSVWEGHDCEIRNCRISEIGSAGLGVWGGERKSLTKCNHIVRGNDIGHCGRLARISGPCLRFGGCGVLVEHNYFHDTPYLTVIYGGNEHLFQYNEIECSMLEAGDGGGIYTGRDWGSRGNVVRWNYLHHFGKDGVELREAQGRPSGCEALKKDVMVEGIYLDDCDSGELIYGNLFYKAGRAMFTGGGRDNTWRHNLVIDCTTAVHFDTRGLQRAKPGSGLKNGWDLLAKIEACDYTKDPWASRYPQLLGIMDKEPLLPIGTEYVSNIAVRCGYFYNSYGDATTFLQNRAPNCANVSYNAKNAKREHSEYPQTNAQARAKLEIRTDDVLAALAESDPVAFQDTPAFKKKFPNFPRIPVEKIGLKGIKRGDSPQTSGDSPQQGDGDGEGTGGDSPQQGEGEADGDSPQTSGDSPQLTSGDSPQLTPFPEFSKARAVTKGPHEHFLANYFAIDAWSPDNRYMLVLETDLNGRLPNAGERCTIGLLDLKNGNEFIPVTTTACWNFQEAAMAHWLSQDEFLFNDLRNGKFVTVVFNWKTKKERILPRPVSAVSPDKTWAVSLNYARLFLTRPDYGYAGSGQDAFEEVEWPENDGLWIMDLHTGESKLVLSVAQGRSLMVPTKVVPGKPGHPLAYYCHTVISADGKKIFFLARSVDWFDKATHKTPYWQTTSFTVDREGTNLRRCFQDGWAGSHFNWHPVEQKMLVTATWNPKHDPALAGHSWSPVEFEVGKEDQVRRIGGGALDLDWHCFYSPDGKFMSGETYWTKTFERPWIIVRLEDEMVKPLGSFYVPEPYRQTYWRCDLHARWRRDGRQLAFNSVHEGSRQVYVIDVKEIGK